ncbi:MAG: N-acetyltransferase family protein [Micrococcales bacterium]
MPNSIALRLATQEDCRQLFEWRNDPTTVAMSLVSEPVPWENHVRWFDSVLGNPARHLLVGEVDGVRCGTVRFDEVDDTAEISITVSPDFRGQGIGGKLLEVAADWAKNELGLGHIIAQIKATNPASIAIFKKAGYEITREGEILALVKYL